MHCFPFFGVCSFRSWQIYVFFAYFFGILFFLLVFFEGPYLRMGHRCLVSFRSMQFFFMMQWWGCGPPPWASHVALGTPS